MTDEQLHDIVYIDGPNWHLDVTRGEAYIRKSEYDRLRRENETLREVEGYIQAAREYRQANGEKANISTAAVERLLDGVTAGPWRSRKRGDADDYVYGFEYFLLSPSYGVVGYWTGHKDNHKEERWCLTEADSAFIAASRDLVPALLADRDRLAAEVERLREALRVERHASTILIETLVELRDEPYIESEGNSEAAAKALKAHAARREGEA